MRNREIFVLVISFKMLVVIKLGAVTAVTGDLVPVHHSPDGLMEVSCKESINRIKMIDSTNVNVHARSCHVCSTKENITFTSEQIFRHLQ